MNIIYFPTPEEVSYHLNKLPKEPEAYKRDIKSLAISILSYNEQLTLLLENPSENNNEEDKK